MTPPVTLDTHTTTTPNPLPPEGQSVSCVQIQPGLWRVTMSVKDFKTLVDRSGFRPKRKESE